MVKFFIQYYNIPTKEDVDRLMKKMDHLEKVVTRSTGIWNGRSVSSVKKTPITSSDVTLKIIKRSRKGVGFPEIHAETGFEEKKLRNIIYNLHKMGKIVRRSHGVYIAS